MKMMETQLLKTSPHLDDGVLMWADTMTQKWTKCGSFVDQSEQD